jgi:hypothetical protein
MLTGTRLPFEKWTRLAAPLKMLRIPFAADWNGEVLAASSPWQIELMRIGHGALCAVTTLFDSENDASIRLAT